MYFAVFANSRSWGLWNGSRQWYVSFQGSSQALVAGLVHTFRRGRHQLKRPATLVLRTCCSNGGSTAGVAGARRVAGDVVWVAPARPMGIPWLGHRRTECWRSDEGRDGVGMFDHREFDADGLGACGGYGVYRPSELLGSYLLWTGPDRVENATVSVEV